MLLFSKSLLRKLFSAGLHSSENVKDWQRETARTVSPFKCFEKQEFKLNLFSCDSCNCDSGDFVSAKIENFSSFKITIW